MKKLFPLIVCGLLAGCDYTVPLVKTPDMPVDTAIIGSWQRVKNDGQTERLLVLPLNKQEYMVSFPAGSPDAMFARACPCRVSALSLVQIQWIGTAKGHQPEDGRVFQYAVYMVAGDTITIRLLNADLVHRNVKTSEELRMAIDSNKEKQNLFREDMVFKKMIQ